MWSEKYFANIRFSYLTIKLNSKVHKPISKESNLVLRCQKCDGKRGNEKKLSIFLFTCSSSSFSTWPRIIESEKCHDVEIRQEKGKKDSSSSVLLPNVAKGIDLSKEQKQKREVSGNSTTINQPELTQKDDKKTRSTISFSFPSFPLIFPDAKQSQSQFHSHSN